ncbi:MAG: hypothetical protein ISS79_00285 [Phycisphaerae bacterium]|nr:hypothetical protein [Phycisphaerae bacterium]
MSDTDVLPLFTWFPRIEVSYENRSLGGSFGSRIVDYRSKRLLWLTATFPRTFRRSVLFGLLTTDCDVETIDITLSYHDGPPGAAISTFKGPFKSGRKFADETGRNEVSFSRNPNTKSGRYTRFEFNTKERLSTNTSALLYDTAGKRHFAGKSGASSGAAGYSVRGEDHVL